MVLIDLTDVVEEDRAEDNPHSKIGAGMKPNNNDGLVSMVSGAASDIVGKAYLIQGALQTILDSKIEADSLINRLSYIYQKYHIESDASVVETIERTIKGYENKIERLVKGAFERGQFDYEIRGTLAEHIDDPADDLVVLSKQARSKIAQLKTENRYLRQMLKEKE